jgi:GT2 family glycosyltransferase
MKLSIITVNFKTEQKIIDCVRSIHKNKPGISYEIIVVDNSNSKYLKKNLQNFKNVCYVACKTNVGFGKGNNIGVRKARGEVLFFLNPDTYIEDGSFKKILSLFDTKRVGIVAPLLLDKNGKVYPRQGTKNLTPFRAIFSISIFSRIFPKNAIAQSFWMKGWNKNKETQAEVVPGTAFFIRADLFEKIGGFDENFFLFFEEFDICRRVAKKGLKILISPQLKVVHFWGLSTIQNRNSKKYFHESRFYYFKKYYSLPVALLTEAVLRISFAGIAITIIFLLGLFLRFYKLPATMIFIGDQGWFYLSALSFIKSGQIPLVGIPSSVVWLHQGPLATYMIAIALFFGKLNPIAPAAFFSILDCITIVLIYFLAKNLSTSRIAGILSALFYATSPLILLTARMPYHTSPIPFVAIIFLLILSQIMKGKKSLLPVLFFCFGLLVQLELSNAVLLLVIILTFLLNRIRITKKEGIVSFAALAVGILPFILYDISHHFVQTLGLPLWIINRTRLFVGLTVTHNSTTSDFPGALHTIISQMEAMFSVYYPFVLVGFVLVFLYFIYESIRRQRTKEILFLLVVLFVPLVSFGVHAAPGVAYFPLLFPIVSICVGASVYAGNKKLPVLIPLFIVLIVINVYGLVSNNYYVTTASGQRALPVNSYSYGYSVALISEAANFMANSSNVHLIGRGFYSKFASNLDNIKYVLLTKNVVLSEKGKTFYVYPDTKSVPNKDDIIFANRIYVITNK